jgi:hypothetical protein
VSWWLLRVIAVVPGLEVQGNWASGLMSASTRALQLQVDDLRHEAKDKVEAETKHADKRAASPGASAP